MQSVKQWTQHIVYSPKYASPALTNLLQHLDEEILKAKHRLKDDKTSTVCLYELDGKPIVIKRSNTKNWFHAIRRSFCKSRAFRSWGNAMRLLEAGIGTFEPIAAVEKRWGPCKGRSYLISSYLDGKQASEVFAYGAEPSQSWGGAASNIVEMLKQLSKSSLSHRDLNLSNIILVDQQPFLIDLDSMCHFKSRLLAKFYAKQDQKRLMKNWVQLPGVHSEVSQLFRSLLQL
ncbi:MAG: lipopolysaccharide kinase InaA family protein [Gammaproteobacteria bacterium]|jgi:tRNA A-37 threonylcarbamoyl transferase component Bud32